MKYIVSLVSVVSVCGLILLFVAGEMPAYSDQAAYDRELRSINNDIFDESKSVSSREASQRFYENQRTYLTNKYDLAKRGGFLVICALYGLA